VKPASFEYLRPVSIDDALRHLAELGPDAKLIAGGQSLGPMMNMRLARPAQLVDLNDLTELAYVKDAGDWLRVGALTRHSQVAESALVRQHCPLLAQAAQTIGHYAIRQRGTIGGSLAHADPAAQFPLIAVTLGARLHLRRHAGRRTIDAGKFFLSAMTTTLGQDELIEVIEFPKAVAGEAASFRLFSRRHGDYAIIAAAVTVALRDGVVNRLRIGLGGATPVPQSLRPLAEDFCGHPPDEAWMARVAHRAAQQVLVEEDSRVSVEYRRELTELLVGQALAHALAHIEP
jgi:aerobic carbon-monoxide dehydrogenase medium subunit